MIRDKLRYIGKGEEFLVPPNIEWEIYVCSSPNKYKYICNIIRVNNRCSYYINGELVEFPENKVFSINGAPLTVYIKRAEVKMYE